MSFFEKIRKKLNKRYWADLFVEVILIPVSNKIQFLKEKIDEIYCNFFFDSLNEDGCIYFEKLLKIIPEEGDSIENRRARIQAKWLSNNHIENWWGNIWKFTNGVIQKNGKLLYKMCEGTNDGSTVENYNTTGDGYIDSGVTLPGTIPQLYIKRMELVPGLGLVPTADAGGTSTTHYCDGMWSDSSVVGFARFGSNPVDGLLVGPFSFFVADPVSHSIWDCGVSLSYKSPL